MKQEVEISCIRCGGSGEVIGGWGHRFTCHSCGGKGKVQKVQDSEKIFLEPNTPLEHRYGGSDTKECPYCCGHGKIFTDWEIICSKCKGTGKIE